MCFDDEAASHIHKINNLMTIVLGQAQLIDRGLLKCDPHRSGVDGMVNGLKELRLLLSTVDPSSQ